VPNMDGLEMVKRVREHLDAEGYGDVEVTIR